MVTIVQGDVKETVKLCNTIQEFYWRTIIKTTISCPKLALRCATFSRDMQWRIYEEKCLLLMRIQNLEKGSLAKVIYQEAEDLGWPGLGREVRHICKVINIPDLNRHRMMKKEVQQAIRVSHYKDMLSQFDSPYFNDKNLENSRMKGGATLQFSWTTNRNLCALICCSSNMHHILAQHMF